MHVLEAFAQFGYKLAATIRRNGMALATVPSDFSDTWETVWLAYKGQHWRLGRWQLLTLARYLTSIVVPSHEVVYWPMAVRHPQQSCHVNIGKVRFFWGEPS